MERLSACNKCENLSSTRNCKLCGCFVDVKSKEQIEYCPANKWKDIKIFEREGIALRCENYPVLVSLSGFHIDFGTTPQNNPVKLMMSLINDRGNFFKGNQDIKDITFNTTCGCTVVKGYPTQLAEGESFDFEINYDAVRIGNVSKTITAAFDKGFFTIVLKGEVI